MGDELVMDVSHPMNRFGIRRGPDVFIIEDHRVPLVSFGIFFPGGRVLESSENAGITELMLHSALEGTRRFNAAEIARRIENAGARIEPVNEADYFGYILDGVSGDLAAALDVLMEVWQEPSFLEGALEAARRLQRARMLENAEEAPLRAVQRLGAAVFAGDPYSLSRLGTPESLEAIDTAALEAWHFEHARSVMPVIVVAGDVNGSGIVSTIANTITNEDLFERDAALLPAPEPADPQPVFTFEEGLPYGVMAYGGSTGAFSSPDGISLRVIRDLLTGHGGRLARAFAAAGVPATSGVGELLMARAGMFHAVVSFVEEGVDGAAIREILDGEFERLALDGLDSEELDSAKARADVVHRIEVDRRRGRVNAVARAVLTGAGPDSVGVFSDVVRRLDSDTLRGAAERFVSSGNIHVIEIR
jgi:zinc protease